MRNFQDTFETRKRPFISVFSICMTVALKKPNLSNILLAKLTWILIGCPGFNLFLKIDNVFTTQTESGTSFHIFGAKDKRLSLP